MENLPVEVLEIVFHPLSKKEDIQNCFNVNSKWRHIIENMFENKSILDSFIMHIICEYIFFYFITHRYNFGEGKQPHQDMCPNLSSDTF